MKQELRTVPVLRLACEMMGHVIIDCSNTKVSKEHARDQIKDGISVAKITQLDKVEQSADSNS